jgi:hypothetical protein
MEFTDFLVQKESWQWAFIFANPPRALQNFYPLTYFHHPTLIFRTCDQRGAVLFLRSNTWNSTLLRWTGTDYFYCPLFDLHSTWGITTLTNWLFVLSNVVFKLGSTWGITPFLWMVLHHSCNKKLSSTTKVINLSERNTNIIDSVANYVMELHQYCDWKFSKITSVDENGNVQQRDIDKSDIQITCRTIQRSDDTKVRQV